MQHILKNSISNFTKLHNVRRLGFCSTDSHKIIYTQTDEAPNLATYSLLPVIQRFAKPYGIVIEKRDISVAGRILCQFNDILSPEQQVHDELTELGELCKTPDGNIIKLPNISAAIPQLKDCIEELQKKGYPLPDFNPNPQTEEEKQTFAKYSKALGSSVNPVLREGNSDRRAAVPVKKNAQAQKKRSPPLLPWPQHSRTCVASMSRGDYYSTEQSHVMINPSTVSIVLKKPDGSEEILKEGIKFDKGDVVDAASINVHSLETYFENEFRDCQKKGLMVSLHLKATMMKVSDPIMFGHCVRVYYKDVWARYGKILDNIGVNPNNGLQDLYKKIENHPERDGIEAAIQDVYKSRPKLAMVNSAKGITNLHVPSDVIIDASMPNVIRDGGQMWNAEDKLEDVKCLIPDRCYGGMYAAIIEDCQENGQFDHTTMGHVSNVGLMAKKAEEYGSHPTTFQLKDRGTVVVIDDSRNMIFSHPVQKGDIWRMCSTKDEVIRNWVALAMDRIHESGAKGVFWTDHMRPHDENINYLAKKYMNEEHDIWGCDIKFMNPVNAIKDACTRARAGKDTISITGNVLRDYLTDLFPIIELGTSAKMLSIVPLLKGGVLLETGAGGSAPKHVEQLINEGHLRWDSLGEYLATAIGFQELGKRANDPQATLLGEAFMDAVGTWNEENRTPGRKTGQLDNRGSNYYIALYWAHQMSKKDKSFKKLYRGLRDNEEQIIKELTDCQGSPQDIGGYYLLDDEKAEKVMRPSPTFNKLIDEF